MLKGLYDRYKNRILTKSPGPRIYPSMHGYRWTGHLSRKKPISAYIGFDATANSLHVGSLVPIMLLRLLQRTGHKPIILMGGGTTKVGDPSGKDKSRQLLTEDEITSNIAGIKSIFERFLNFGEGPNDAILFNNAEWLDPLEYIPFLRDFGQHFSINRMLGFESVKQRLDREQPLSFLEFNYMVLQAYDFSSYPGVLIAVYRWEVPINGAIYSKWY